MKSLARPERWNSNCKRGAGEKRSPQSVRSAGEWMNVRVQLAKRPKRLAPPASFNLRFQYQIWGALVQVCFSSISVRVTLS